MPTPHARLDQQGESLGLHENTVVRLAGPARLDFAYRMADQLLELRNVVDEALAQLRHVPPP